MIVMNKLQKKYLEEYLAAHPEVRRGKKKNELTFEEIKKRNDSRRKAHDKARNRSGW